MARKIGKRITKTEAKKALIALRAKAHPLAGGWCPRCRVYVTSLASTHACGVQS